MIDRAFAARRRAWRGAAFWVVVLLLPWVAVRVGSSAGALPPRSGDLERPGAALRRAVDARAEERLDEAADLFARAARHHPLVADHATLLRARSLVAAGRADDAIAVAWVFERDHPESPLLADVQQLLGDAFADVGDEGSARDAWQLALDNAGARSRRSELRFALAASHERSGDPGVAAELYRTQWRANPRAASDPETTAALTRLSQRLGRTLPTRDDRVRRADSLYRARSNEAALALYDRVLASGIGGARRRSVQRQRAFTLFRLRRYVEATRAFDALGSGTEARFWHARCLARQGRIQDSIRAFEKIGKGRSSLALRSRYLAATLLEGEGDRARARAHFEAVASRGNAAQRSAAGWRLGWAAFQAGDDREALRQFARLARKDPDPIGALRWRYWETRTRERLGEADAAQRFASLAAEYPFTYYGWRAASRIDPALLERRTPRSDPLAPVSLAPRSLARIRALLEAGLAAEAETELRGVARSARGAADRLELARLYTEASAYNRAQRLVLDVYQERLARGPAPGDEELWWYAWPRAFASRLSAAAEPVPEVEPELVMAVMREESGYRPAVVSPVGARGLMQIMPDTGRRLAADLGIVGFDPDHLFQPATNMRLGSFYLGELLGSFDGRASAAIASYNAGPRAVSRWLRERPSLPDDEWVEAIPYDETRGYVRRVLRSLHAYRVLY